MKKRIGVSLLTVMVLFGFSVAGSANTLDDPDPFVGSRMLTLYGDSNIQDGFTLSSDTQDFAVSTDDRFHYTVAAGGGDLSLSMVRSGNQLSLSPRPQGSAVHSYLLANGSVGAFLLMGQEIDNPADISIRLATWAPDTPVLGSQLAGDWELTWIEDTNLRNDPVEPFEMNSETWSIFDLGSGLVEVHFRKHSATWRMQIVDNTLVPTPELLEAMPSLAHLSIVTDGNAIALAMVGVEPWDFTDISSTIALGARSTGANGSGSSTCQCPVTNCSQLQLGVSIDPSISLTFYLIDTPGPFQLIHGILQPIPTAGDPDYKPILFSGTGQTVDLPVGSESHRVFFMNLHSSQEHADQSPQKYYHDGRVVQISLDLSTLNGTFWSVGTGYNAASDQKVMGFDKFNVNLVGQLPSCLRQQ